MISTNPFQEIVDSLAAGLCIHNNIDHRISHSFSSCLCGLVPWPNLAPYSGLEEGCNIFFLQCSLASRWRRTIFPLRNPSSPLYHSDFRVSTPVHGNHLEPRMAQYHSVALLYLTAYNDSIILEHFMQLRHPCFS